MNYKMIGRILSMVALAELLFMIPALLISVAYDRDGATHAFAVTIAAVGILSLITYFACIKSETHFYAREGLVSVGLGWIVLSLIGCLPFYISGEIPNFLDAFFESVSGFTTTGASIMSNVEGMTEGMLYWRSFTHWLGGMGVLVFILAVIPASGKGSGFTMHLLRAESPGPDVGKLVPRMRQTAVILYGLYIVLTVLDFIFLLAGHMDVLEAICTAFGTAGTGGFGVKNDSIASYSPYIQNVCTVFMILFGINFTCYYFLLLGKVKDVFKDEELRLYLGVITASIVLIAINIRPMYGTLGETVRHSAFQVATVITTTGFATTDFDMWPTFSKMIMVMLMFIGASAGSTGGGFKCGRLLLLFKTLRRNLEKTLNPQKIKVVRNNGRPVNEKVLLSLYTYLIAYVFIMIVSILIVSLNGESMTTTVTAVIACFNNIGPGLDGVGPTCNYGGLNVLSKVTLIFDMLAGRLEIFPILLLITRKTWKKLV
ncbi:MAG: TrkH family potassium uptake protein [Lachnospiraceae bacterium]|nr:TrkH family potassium uptake protein [Lachnospiraceae bacterium]